MAQTSGIANQIYKSFDSFISVITPGLWFKSMLQL